MKVFLSWVSLAISLGLCWAPETYAQSSQNTRSVAKINVYGRNDIDGRKKFYIGRILVQDTMIISAEVLDSLTAEDKNKMMPYGGKIEGNKLVMPASPLSGYVARLGDQMEFIDKNGFFSFDTIPDGISEVSIFAQLSDTKPFVRFPVAKLVKNGGNEIAPFILHVKSDLDKVLDQMDK